MDSRQLQEAAIYEAADAMQAWLDKEVVIPRTQSLEVATGDQNGDLVEFTRDMYIERMCKHSNCDCFDDVLSPPYPLYLSHVLWSVGFHAKEVKDDVIKLSLVHIGPHLAHNRHERPDPDLNSPKGLETPAILAASLTFLSGPNKEERERFELTAALEVPRTFSRRDLLSRHFEGKVHMRIRIVIARSYFSLAKLIDLKEKPTVERDGVVASILRSEKPAGADWILTVAEAKHAGKGQGDTVSSCFHVHKEALASRSYAFKKLFDSRRSVHNFIQIQAGRAGCKLLTLTPDDMRVVIPLLYCTAVPLPEGKASVLLQKLERFFKADILTTVLYPQWQRAICKSALAINKASYASTTSVRRLLDIVWACPYGTMPVAKRVAIGVIADMMHLNGGKHSLHYMEVWGFDVCQTIQAMVSGTNKEGSMDAAYSHHGKVVVVHKRLFSAAQSAATAAAPDDSADATVGDVVIDVADGDEEWHDAESIDNQHENGKKWGCAIC